MKQCSKCHKWKLRDGFDKDRRAKNGLASSCKNCRRRYRRTYKIKIAKYRQIHKVEIHKQRKKWRHALRGYLSCRLGKLRQRCDNPNDISHKHYRAKRIKCLFKDIDEFFYHITIDLGFDTVDKLRGLEIHRTGKHYEVGGIELLTHAKHAAKHKKINKKNKTIK